MKNIEEVYALVADLFLQRGRLPPIVFVEIKGKDKPYMIPHVSRDFVGDIRDKALSLFLMGRDFAEDQKIEADSINVLYFATTTKFVETAIEDGKNDSVVREALSESAMPEGEWKDGVSVMELYPQTRSLLQKMHLAQVIRSGESVDLLPLRVETIQSLLLPSFFAGVCVAGKSTDQIIAEFQAAQAGKERGEREQ